MRTIVLLLGPLDHDTRVLKSLRFLRSRGPADILCLGKSEQVPDAIAVNFQASRRLLPGVSALLLRIRFLAEALRLVCASEACVCYCNDLGALQVGCLLRAIRGPCVRIIYDSHEFAINDRPGEGRLHIFGKYLMERMCIGRASGVICVSDSIANEYGRMYRIPRPTLVLNCPPSQDVVRSDLIRTTLGLREDQRICLYQGRLTSGRGIELLMDSFQARQADHDVIVFMGNGPSTQVISDRAAACPRIRILPAVPPQELLLWTASADYGVCFIEDSCLSYRYCLPNKLFEYMMAGIPVLASNTIDVKGLVEKEGVGVVAKENSIAGFDEALDRLLQTDPSKWRENARRASATFCWEQQEARLGELLDRVTGSLAAEP